MGNKRKTVAARIEIVNNKWPNADIKTWWKTADGGKKILCTACKTEFINTTTGCLSHATLGAHAENVRKAREKEALKTDLEDVAGGLQQQTLPQMTAASAEVSHDIAAVLGATGLTASDSKSIILLLKK